MTAFKVGYFVGSLARGSINRKLATALVRLAPSELEMGEIPIADLPLYSYDYDADYPPPARALKDAIAAVDAVIFVTPEVQPLDPGRAQERDRLGQPAVGEELVQPEAVGHDRHLARQDRHRRGAAAPQEHSQLLQLTADECVRGLHRVHARARHRRRRGDRGFHREVPAQLHAGVPRVHLARIYRDPAHGRIETCVSRTWLRRPRSHRVGTLPPPDRADSGRRCLGVRAHLRQSPRVGCSSTDSRRCRRSCGLRGVPQAAFPSQSLSASSPTISAASGWMSASASLQSPADRA